MELQLFKTLWGHDGDLGDAIDQALYAGFQGLEGQPSSRPHQCREHRQLLDKAGLAFIAEICTAGGYVPDRTATVAAHLDDLSGKLDRAALMGPTLVNCIGGCDAWPVADSVAFFREAGAMARHRNVRICFETHRGRSLFSPWRTAEILERLDLELTCDFSHWSVVCEGLGTSEDALIRDITASAGHIHGRIGYDQGPQVPDPAADRYRPWLKQHQRWWEWVWAAQWGRGAPASSLTPEFGPDGYQAIDATTGDPVGDLWNFNCWLAAAERRHFKDFIDRQTQPTGDR